MYIFASEGLGQSPEMLSDFDDEKRRFDAANAEHLKRLAPPALGVLPLDVLRKAGLTTETRINKSTAALLQSVLERSRVLRPYIAGKLISIKIPKNFIHHDFDKVFEHKLVSLHNIVIPMGSSAEKELKNIYGFYHAQTQTIHLRPSANIGHALHEAIHKFASPGFLNIFGKFLNEGVTHYFTDLVLVEQGLLKSKAYAEELACAKNLVRICGRERVAQAYFLGSNKLAMDIVRLLNISLLDLYKLKKQGDASLCAKINKIIPN
ncbi:hypothetical protein [Methylomonas albis]|uniref:Uncharacterized protein n=1 Tax=Methylomonas albis TaxID=1854563 RepID=A0ABR9D166_9GAMM|nr:hypothetical protein [Methylomonas albis]MBD9356760.1 hypothetical protein [Methylomonas albis]